MQLGSFTFSFQNIALVIFAVILMIFHFNGHIQCLKGIKSTFNILFCIIVAGPLNLILF